MAISLAPILKKSYWVLVGLGGLYLLFLSALTNVWAQRQALYAHKANTAGWWHNLSQPEQFGFVTGQIQELRLPTSDGESLYGWHVLPLGVCSKHMHELETIRTPANAYEESAAFNFLSDPDTKLIINFHGNAGHVGQGWRTDAYQAMLAVDNQRAHVISFDYRGFGHSTGTPNEEGLILDGLAVLEYFFQYVPPSRVVIVGHSLGVAVSIAAVERLQERSGIDVGSMVLVSGFSDLTTLLSTYAILHAIPIFSPLRPYPRIQKFFENRIADTWYSFERLYRYVKAAKSVDITFIHARNDYDIPWAHSSTLFATAANATSAEGMTYSQIEAMREHRSLPRKGFVNEWKARGATGGLKKLTQVVLRDGGHDRIITFAPVIKAIMDGFNRKA